MSNLRPRCDCPRSSYHTEHKISREKQDLYLREVSYDIDECKNHPQSHVNRRNEVHRVFMFPAVELPAELNSEEEVVFRLVFNNCQTKKIPKSAWSEAVGSQFSLESAQRAFLDKFLQSAVVELVEEYYSTKTGKKEYVLLTDQGYDFLKRHLDVIERNEQITHSRQLIEETLKTTPQLLNPQLNRLTYLIKTQLEKIASVNPCWEKDTGEKVKPESVQTKPPTYYIITKALCTWIKMYRERMTKRELSCLSFVDDPLVKDNDPSKVLNKYYDGLEAIIQPRSLGYRDLDDFGLTKTLETVQLSGSITIAKGDHILDLKGPLILLDSYEYQNIKSITSKCHHILCVENLAVFTQLVYDKFAMTENILIIFIHGKSSRYLQKILQILANNEQKCDWWAWLDYDLGGVEIFQFVEGIIAPHVVNPILPGLSETNSYRPISPKNRARIQKIIEKGTASIQQLGKHVLSKGKIEQEYFIKDYKVILKSYIK
ncbi:MAG: hypothetical protein RBG13Loki_1525 [Promethearchaeota archaeon CR_4]|nr:MAG: hypothetical protein RBG13Loki_1525 [Candidatus Lokiarchaeota archaeon CR_4]